MIKIEKIQLRNLRNNAHFQFHTEFSDLVTKFGAKHLKVESQFKRFRSLFKQEDAALKKVIKSAITAEIQGADKYRDQLFRGMADSNKTALKHFDEDVRTSAKRLQILFDTYGNLAQKPLNEETAAICNLIQELNDHYLADAKCVGITDWMRELEKSNDFFSRLVKDRYEENAMKTDLILKDVRQQVDDVYRVIIEHINALVVVEGDIAYREFIRNLNSVIAQYTVAILQHAVKTDAVKAKRKRVVKSDE